MKKIFVLILSLFMFSFSFSIEKPEYITKVVESKYDPGEYSAYIDFEQGFSDKGTIGLNFVRVCHSLKYLQEQYPDGKWFYVDCMNGDNTFMSGNFKAGKVNLIDKQNNIELGKELILNGNTIMPISVREKLYKFITDGYIPMM